jgi:hypothetical protein
MKKTLRVGHPVFLPEKSQLLQTDVFNLFCTCYCPKGHPLPYDSCDISLQNISDSTARITLTFNYTHQNSLISQFEVGIDYPYKSQRVLVRPFRDPFVMFLLVLQSRHW